MAIDVMVDGLDTSLAVTLEGLSTIEPIDMQELVIVESPPYEGDYEVTSLPFVEQEYETKNKKMTDNLIVKAIPYEEVSNPQGGKTVTIGGY